MLLIRSLSRDDENERGSALLAALGLTAVAAVIAIVVTTTSLFSVGYTTSTLAAVQSQAAAEAGVDFAAASVSSTTTACQANYSNSSAPKFTVAVSYSVINPVPSTISSTGLTWVSGCPTLAATLVKFVSTGTASNAGLVGNSGGNTRRVEAIYPFRANPAGTGAALYSYQQTDRTATNLTLTTGASATPSIQYFAAPNGLVCTSAGNSITGNLIVGSGDVTVGTGCQINGSLSAGGVISMAGTVTGNVTSSAPSSTSAPAISVTGTVGNSVYAGGPVSISGPVTRNVVAGPGLGITTISDRVSGSVTVAGTVNYSHGGTVVGSVSVGQLGMVAPAVPFVPGWVDYPYSSTDWTGYLPSVLTQADCSSATVVTAKVLAAIALPASIIDATACDSAGPTFSGLPRTLTLTGNLVIVAKGLQFPSSGNSFVSSTSVSTAPHKKLWLIIPDPIVDQRPTPAACATHTIDVGSLTVAPSGNVDGMIYSPCPITNSPVSWQGQIYTNGMSMSNGFQLSYVPLGLPGYDLANPPGSPGAAPGVLGTRTSIRNIV